MVNNALRVGHKWDNSIGYLVDENGLSYENNKEYQATINKHNSFGLKNIYNTPHSSSDTTILVFELPPTVTKPFLMVRGGLLMGDVFDGARFRKIKVKLF